MKAPLQSRSENSSALMTEAALWIASQEGLGAVTIARVSAVSGQSNGALYHRFQSREGLLLATSDWMLTHIESQMRESLAAIGSDLSEYEALRALVMSNRRLFSDHLGGLRAFMIEGRGIKALEDRGNCASQAVGRDVCEWLISRFQCSQRTADFVFRLLFAVGTLQIAIDDESLLTQAEISHKEADDDLAAIFVIQLRNCALKSQQ